MEPVAQTIHISRSSSDDSQLIWKPTSTHVYLSLHLSVVPCLSCVPQSLFLCPSFSLRLYLSLQLLFYILENFVQDDMQAYKRTNHTHADKH